MQTRSSASLPFAFSNTHLCNWRSQTLTFPLSTMRLRFLLSKRYCPLLFASHQDLPPLAAGTNNPCQAPNHPGTQTTSPARPPQTPSTSNQIPLFNFLFVTKDQYHVSPQPLLQIFPPAAPTNPPRRKTRPPRHGTPNQRPPRHRSEIQTK